MECIGIGDTHFDKLNSLIPDASALICRSMGRVFDYALDKGVEHVLLYGDIGEKPRLSYESQVALYKLLLKKRYRALQIHVILGNHDFAEDGTHTLQVMDVIANALDRNVHVYTKRSIEVLDGVKFNFLPYPFTDTRKDSINVGHFEVAGSLRDNGKKIEEGLASKHVTLMGHLHTNHVVRNTYFSGTLYQTNFGESLPKYFHHVTTSGPKDTQVESVRFEPPWKLLNLTVNSASDLEQIENEHNTLYKLFLKKGLDIDLDRVLQQHPNIVRHNTFESKKDLAQLVQREWDFDTEVMSATVNDLDDKEIVREFLASAGMSKRQIDRGFGIIKRLRG